MTVVFRLTCYIVQHSNKSNIRIQVLFNKLRVDQNIELFKKYFQKLKWSTYFVKYLKM